MFPTLISNARAHLQLKHSSLGNASKTTEDASPACCYSIEIDTPEISDLPDLLSLAVENGLACNFRLEAADPGRQRIEFFRVLGATDESVAFFYDAGCGLDRSVCLQLAQEIERAASETLRTVVDALRGDLVQVHGLHPESFEATWRGMQGRHDWCVGRKTGDDGFPVYVDDRPLGYRSSREEARSYAFEIIARLRADGDYLLNQKPAGHLPPPLSPCVANIPADTCAAGQAQLEADIANVARLCKLEEHLLRNYQADQLDSTARMLLQMDDEN